MYEYPQSALVGSSTTATTRRRGHELHDTRKGGNQILRTVFNLLHATPPDRSQIPPFFIFQKYLLGLSEDPVYAEFSLEAKCYRPPIGGMKGNTVGVKEVARLISRIKNRQFGVLVTTSVIGRQVYEEVREDRHPIIFLAGGDITNILMSNGFNTPELVTSMLRGEFAVSGV